MCVDEQPVAGAGLAVPLGHHALEALVGGGRVDPCLDGEASVQSETGIVGHHDEGTGMELLDSPRILTVGRRVEVVDLRPRASGVVVAVPYASQLGAVTRRLAAHHEPYGLSRLGAQLVGVADDLHIITSTSAVTAGG